MNCKVNKPYPPIEVLSQNPYYGELILEDMAGLVSEMSAISLYMYNNIIIPDCDELSDLKESFKCINMVEMKHIDMLGQLALKLGVDPRLWTNNNGNCQYWTPFNNCYPNQLEALLKNSIISEQQAIQQYQSHINCIDDPYIKNILARIIEDETLHLKIFQHYYNSLVNINQ